MQDYALAIEVLQAVLAGKNLNEQLRKVSSQATNMGKLRSICSGVLRHYYSINFAIKHLSTREAVPTVTTILQIAFFELKYSQKPVYAICNDMVNLSEDIFGHDRYKGFINAMLRNFIRQMNEIDAMLTKDYSLLYEMPNWLIDTLKKQDKTTYLQILQGLNTHPAFGIRYNAQKYTLKAYLSILDNANIKYTIVDNKIVLEEAIDVLSLPAFASGGVSIQDIGAQYLLDVIKDINLGENVLDACAAPGGKTCQLLENYPNLDLTSLDFSHERLKQVYQNIERLKLECNIIAGDASKQDWWDDKQFDSIIADVPCSATGTIKRNSDIKVMRKETDIANFVKIQRDIVSNLWDMLAQNGYMIYITCSILQAENQDNISYFTNHLEDFKLISEKIILPTKYNDGLYYALVQKKA